MKKAIKALILFFVILAAGLTAFLVYSLTVGADKVTFWNNVKESFRGRLINTQEVSLDGISVLDIAGNNCDVVFLPGDSETMVIKEYVGNQARQEPFVTAAKRGNTLELTTDKKNNTFIVMGSNIRYFEVYLPGSQWSGIKVESSSGDVKSELDFTCTSFRIHSASGYIDLEKVTAEEITIETDSGDVIAAELNGKKAVMTKSGYVKINGGKGNIELETTSGDVILEDISGGIVINTTSGYVSGKNIDGAAQVETTSGDIILGFVKLSGDLRAESKSGYISCTLPGQAAFNFRAETNSGAINTYFDESLSYDESGKNASGKVGVSAMAEITVKTSSGDIRIKD